MIRKNMSFKKFLLGCLIFRDQTPKLNSIYDALEYEWTSVGMYLTIGKTNIPCVWGWQ